MSKYTAELRQIVKLGYEIFDFDYPRNETAEQILSNEKLQQGFIDRYYFREVGFETLERFKHKLKTQWLESIENFDKLLVAYNENVNVKSNVSSEIENVSIYNDTPKSALDYGEQSNHASSITNNKQKTKGYTGLTEIEMLELYHNNLRDIVSEYYDTFDNLFMQIF